MTMRAYLHRHTVTFDETNLVGNVYFAHYLHWQGHCRERFLAEHSPLVLKELSAGELAMVTVSCQMTYYEECFALEEIDVLMSLGSTQGNRVTMNFDFKRGATLVARGGQTIACLRRAPGGMVATPVPEELATALRAYS